MTSTSVREGQTGAVDVVVVGAGFAGLYAAYRLREAGYSVQGVERAGDVGGTWYWNRYPGARCDIPSLMYAFTFSEDLRREWRWSEKYAAQPEILAYACHVADRFDLRRSFLFETSVTDCVWSETEGRWTITTDCGDRFTARFCIMATGILSVPRKPDIPGAEGFVGDSLVTGTWPHEGYDFTGKRVALVGTGSSAIQSLPHIAATAAEVHVLQRTPNYSLPALNRPLTDEERAAWDEAFPHYLALVSAGKPPLPEHPDDWQPADEELAPLIEGLWNGGGLVSIGSIPNVMKDPAINERACQFVRERIREIVADPAVAERLTPSGFPIGAKRACVDTDYYATFNRPNVHLVDLRETPLERIAPDAVVTSAGPIPVDTIVYGLGFDAVTGAVLRINPVGRGGRTLAQAWADGPSALLGLMVSGFPNLFVVTGPGSPSALSNVILSIEQHVDWIMALLAQMREEGTARVEADAAAQQAWAARTNEVAEATLYPRANSWYIGANVPGKPRRFMLYVGFDYKQHLDAAVANRFEDFVFDG